MAQEQRQADAETATGEESENQETGNEGLDAPWVMPAILILAAKGVRAFGEGRVWGWVAMGLAVLAAVITVAVFVGALRRKAYETLMTMAVGALFVGVIAYVKGVPL